MKNRLTHLRTGLCSWAVAVCCFANPVSSQIKTITLEKGTSVETLRLSPDGKFIVGACEIPKTNYFEIRMWEIESGKTLGKIGIIPKEESTRGIPAFPRLALSSDSRRLACSNAFFGKTRESDQVAYLKVWDIKSDKLLMDVKVKQHHIRRLSFGLDSSTLFTDYFKKNSPGNETGISLWDIRTGKETKKVKLKNCYAQIFEKWVLTIGWIDGTIRFWDRTTLKEDIGRRFQVGFRGSLRRPITGLLHPQTGLMAFSLGNFETGNHTLNGEIWNLKQRKRISQYGGSRYHSQYVGNTFSKEGSLLAAFLRPRIRFDEKEESYIYVWETKTGKVLHKIDLGESPRTTTPYFVLDKKLLILRDDFFSSKSSLEIRSIPEWKILTSHQISSTELPSYEHDFQTFSPDKKMLILWGKLVLEKDGKEPVSRPTVFQGQIKIIEVKALLKKAQAEEKRKVKIK